MKKRFNSTGVCIPEKHYMVDISNKTAKIFSMVRQGDYFVISRPRQYGKTTTVYMLSRYLKTLAEYFPIQISFEGIGSESYLGEKKFIEAFLLTLKEKFLIPGDEDTVEFIEASSGVDSIKKLDICLKQLVMKIGKKVVLIIDEVDKSSNNQLFLDFLGMLRDKYLKSVQGEDITFHSVILVGVYDVKSLKGKLRPDEEAKYNSPWNIAVDFEVDLAFNPEEISSMLKEYSEDQQVNIDVPFFADYIFYFTSGYPFLVSYLCKIIAETIMPGKNKREWQPEDLVRAVQIALAKDNTNFESLIKNLENNPKLYELVFKIVMNEKEFSYNRRNSIIHLGTLYGILKEENSKTRIHNRLYEQLIYDYMSSNLETSEGMAINHISSSYFHEDGKLNIDKIIGKFQEFMKEQYSTRDKNFLERNGRLLFLAFIKPIINGKGFDFKEAQISEEKRLDVVITVNNTKYIVELKIWRGDSYHREGIRQLCDYLDRQNQSAGYLIIYDLRRESGRVGYHEKIEDHGKEIFVAWV